MIQTDKRCVGNASCVARCQNKDRPWRTDLMRGFDALTVVVALIVLRSIAVTTVVADAQ
jgi:hypothetical protein